MKTLYKVQHCLSSKPAASSFALRQCCDCAVLPQPPKWICELVPPVFCSFPCLEHLCLPFLLAALPVPPLCFLPPQWALRLVPMPLAMALLCPEHVYIPDFVLFKLFFPQFSNFSPERLRAGRGNSLYGRNHFLLICFTYWHLIQDFLLVVVVV